MVSCIEMDLDYLIVIGKRPGMQRILEQADFCVAALLVVQQIPQLDLLRPGESLNTDVFCIPSIPSTCQAPLFGVKTLSKLKIPLFRDWGQILRSTLTN